MKSFLLRCSTPICVSDSEIFGFEQEVLWKVLSDVENYEKWWPPNLKVCVLKMTTEVVGSEFRIWPKFGRPFFCRFVKLTHPSNLVIEYFNGFVKGRGEWVLEQRGDGCLVTYNLDVRADGLIVSLLGRMGLLDNFHSRPMKDVFKCLERECSRHVLGRDESSYHLNPSRS